MDCTHFLEAAFASPRGVLIETTDVEILKRKLYKARQDAQARGVEIFNDLSFRVDPRFPKTQLLIIKKGSPE